MFINFIRNATRVAQRTPTQKLKSLQTFSTVLRPRTYACSGGCPDNTKCITDVLNTQKHKTPRNSPFIQEEFYTGIRAPLNKCSTTNPMAYYDEDYYKVELEKVWKTTWSCVGVTQNLKSHGDTIVAEIAGQPIIVTKTKKGEIRGFYNVCRHRGHKIVKNNGKYPVLSCPYHRWGYSLEGKLIATPLFTEEEKMDPNLTRGFDTNHVENFDKADYGLFPVRVEVIENFVFACVNPEAPSLKTLMGDYVPVMAPYKLQDLVIAREKTYSVKANWKLLQENFMEYLHLPSIHPALNTISCVKDHIRYQGPGQYTGFITKPLTNSGTPCDVGVIPNLPGLPEEYSDMAMFHQLFPNVFYDLLPSHMYMVFSTPKSAGLTEEKGYLFVHPDVYKEENAEEKIQAMWDFYDNVNIEDLEACEEVQLGIQCTPYQGGRLAFKFEETIHRWQNIFVDFMTEKPRVPLGDDKHALGADFSDSIPWDKMYEVNERPPIPNVDIINELKSKDIEEKKAVLTAKKLERRNKQALNNNEPTSETVPEEMATSILGVAAAAVTNGIPYVADTESESAEIGGVYLA